VIFCPALGSLRHALFLLASRCWRIVDVSGGVLPLSPPLEESMPAREYGIPCLTCKRFITMGEVELPDKAQLADLRRALSEEGEQGGSLQCPYCGAVVPLPRPVGPHSDDP